MNEFNYKRIAAIDYGEKRIGIALTDQLQTFAYPYKTLINNYSIWKELQKIITEMEIEKIILGYPLKESGEESRITINVKTFNVELKKIFKGEIILLDERYSSSIAEERILESVNKKSKRREKGLIDRNAAAVILESYLNSR